MHEGKYMATVIRSMSDLTKIIESRIQQALKMTQQEIFEVIQQKVFDYYEEPVFATKRNPNPSEPEYYKRGQADRSLMDSLAASHITKNGNLYEFTVGWGRDYLTFRYPAGFGNSQYNGITGLQVLQSFDSGFHGYTVHGSHNFWSEAIEELGGEEGIKNRFKKNLRKCGLDAK